MFGPATTRSVHWRGGGKLSGSRLPGSLLPRPSGHRPQDADDDRRRLRARLLTFCGRADHLLALLRDLGRRAPRTVLALLSVVITHADAFCGREMVAPFAPITAPRSFPTCIETSHSFVISAESFSPQKPPAASRSTVRSISAARMPAANRFDRFFFVTIPVNSRLAMDATISAATAHANASRRADDRERLRPRRTRTACRAFAHVSLLEVLADLDSLSAAAAPRTVPTRRAAARGFSVSILSSRLRRRETDARAARRRYDSWLFGSASARIEMGSCLLATPSSPFRDSDGAISCSFAPAEGQARAEVLAGSSRFGVGFSSLPGDVPARGGSRRLRARARRPVRAARLGDHCRSVASTIRRRSATSAQCAAMAWQRRYSHRTARAPSRRLHPLDVLARKPPTRPVVPARVHRPGIFRSGRGPGTPARSRVRPRLVVCEQGDRRGRLPARGGAKAGESRASTPPAGRRR